MELTKDKTYTKFGVNYMGVTTRTTFKFISMYGDKIHARVKDNKTGKFKPGIYAIDRSNSVILEGEITYIYTDYEVKIRDGSNVPAGNSCLNLVADDKDILISALKSAIYSDETDMFFYSKHGSYREEEGEICHLQ